MTKHSRHHRRSLLSGIRKWMGYSHSKQKVHRTHFKKTEAGEDSGVPVEEKDSSSVELPAKGNVHQRQAGVRAHHQRQKPKKGWMQQLKYRLSGLFVVNRSHSRNISNSRQVSELEKLAGDGSDLRKRELFYKLDKDGEYKVIQANPVTSTGINERGITPKVPDRGRIHPHRQKRHQGWFRNFTQSIHNFKRLFTGKRKHIRSPKHSLHDGAQVVEAVSVPVPKEFVQGFSNGLKHTRFNFSELINSWLKLSFLLKLLSSAGLFMAAYVITWLTYSLAVMFTASFYDIYGVLYYFEVMWPESSSSPLWTDSNAFAIAIAGPFISLVLSMVYFTVLLIVKNLGTQFKTFIFWLFLLSMAHFSGALVAGAFTRQGFGYMMYGQQTAFIFRLLISILSLGAMALIGLKYTRFILEIRLLRKHGNNIPLILINRMVLPALLGILLLIIIKIPNITPQHSNIQVYDVVILLSVLFAVIPPLFNKKLRPAQHPLKTVIMRDRTARAIFAIIFSFAVLILYRFGLSTGLFVYMKFAIHISSF